MPFTSLCSFEMDAPPSAVAETLASVANPVLKLPVFESCIPSVDDLNFHSKRQQLRDVAVGKLLVVMFCNLGASDTSGQFLEECTHEQSQQKADDILDTVLGVRSPATLIKSANTLLASLR